jgi:8-oxo-dGTP diphosphatase
MGLDLSVADLHLAGIISEHGYEGQSHWLMFLFEVKVRLQTAPPPHREGRFAFVGRDQLFSLPLPQTDRERIWPWFFHFRGGFFSAHCYCHAEGRFEWTLEEGYSPLATPSQLSSSHQPL